MFSLILNPDLNMYAPVHANKGKKGKIWLMKGKSKSREGGRESEGRMEQREKISSVFFLMIYVIRVGSARRGKETHKKSKKTGDRRKWKKYSKINMYETLIMQPINLLDT